MYSLDLYSGLKVLVTGHTGFKGSWLSMWLKMLGADVIGYSLESPTKPNLFSCCQLQNKIKHYHGDIMDEISLEECILESQPDIIFHLAAQSLVIDSFQSPKKTFLVNSQGTINVLDAGIKAPSVKAMVIVTTDKVYENVGWCWGYRENDPLGAHDPYSTSKAMAELAIDSYRKSFCLNTNKAIASARSGNVIGGGDFSDHRLIPDIIKAISEKKAIHLRNPQNTRPWMYILDTLHGYLVLGSQLLQEPKKYNEAWNFAPKEQVKITCQEIVEEAISYLGYGDWYSDSQSKIYPEMHELRLNGEKTANYLNWMPYYSWKESLHETLNWYRQFMLEENMYAYSINQIEIYHNQRQESHIYGIY